MGKVLGGRPPDEVEVYAEPLMQRSQVRASTLLYRQFLTREVRPLLARRYAGQRLTVPVHFMVGSEDLLFYEGMVDEPAPHADAEYRGEVLPESAISCPTGRGCAAGAGTRLLGGFRASRNGGRASITEV